MVKGNGEGRRRLGLVLGGLSGGLSLLLMAAVVIVYGMPYDDTWWGVMAIIAVAAFIVPRMLAPVVEWVIEGYRGDG